MQSSSRAPVLSATFSLDSCWITPLPCLLEDLDEAPALRARQRPAFDDAHHVALVRLVALVVGVQPVGLAQDLLVETVAADALETDGDRLLALARHHNALPDLARAGLALGRGLLGGRAARTRRMLGTLLLAPAAALSGLAATLFGALGEPFVGGALG